MKKTILTSVLFPASLLVCAPAWSQPVLGAPSEAAPSSPAVLSAAPPAPLTPAPLPAPAPAPEAAAVQPPVQQPQTPPAVQPATDAGNPAQLGGGGSTRSAGSAAGVYYNTRGGDSYDTAVLPPLGQDLKLNHHQKRGAYDYFMVDLKAGQTLKARLSVGEKGVEIRPDNTTLETGYPYAGLVVYDAGGNQVGILDFNGSEKNLQKTLEVDASTPQRIYLLLGSGAGAVNKEYAGFRVEIQDNFDADGAGEAGATIETALTLDPGDFRKTYERNHLTRNDEADFFKIPTKPGQSLSIEVEPKNPVTTAVVALYDELRVELARGRSAKPGEATKLNAKANTSATFLKVTRELSDEPTDYDIRFVLPPPETRPAETRPIVETAPTVLPTVTPTDIKVGSDTVASDDTAAADFKDRKEKLREERDKKSKKTKKVAWWKDPKMLTWGGGAVGGVLVLLLGGLVLLRKKKAKTASSE